MAQATKTQQRRAPVPEPPKETEQAVAVFQAPRLPFHPEIEKRFKIGRAEWRALTDAIFPAAKTADAIMLALSYCKARRLDIFKRPVHIVPIWDGKLNREVESVWPGIGELRTTAMRTGSYAGNDEPEFGPMRTETFRARVKDFNSNNWKDEEATVSFAEWCRVTVYKMVQGQRVAFFGPKVHYLEFYSKKSRYSSLPNEMWSRKGHFMLEKCAEAGALRRAFPDELGDQFSVEEAGFFGAYDARPVDAEIVSTSTPNAEKPAAPTRAQFEAEADENQAGTPVEGTVQGTATENGAPVTSAADPDTADGGEPEKEAKPSIVKNWNVVGVVGQDPILAAIFNLLDNSTETPEEVDALKAVHAGFIAKLGAIKQSDLNRRFADRRAILENPESEVGR